MMAGNELKSVPWRLMLFSLSFLCLARATVALARARKGIEIAVKHWSRIRGGELFATSSRVEWAVLLRRTYGIDALRCPKCAARMRVLATITDSGVVKKILSHLGRRTEPLSRARARDPTGQESFDEGAASTRATPPRSDAPPHDRARKGEVRPAPRLRGRCARELQGVPNGRKRASSLATRSDRASPPAHARSGLIRLQSAPAHGARSRGPIQGSR
jgi:hypothetical protein